MSIMQQPAEDDYWKAGQSGAILFSNFIIWMSCGRFMFTENIRMSDYTTSRANIAPNKLWTVRDSIIETRDICKYFLPGCTGDATINKARIPGNARAPYI
eukprot:13812896-Ditylum_brightwellii.AAC.1